MSNDPISEQYRIVAKQWVAANTAADMLEECKSAVLSQKMRALGDMPVSRAEMEVRASDEWTDYVRQMVEARGKANLLKVQCEYLKMRHSEQQSHEANARAEMRL